MLITVVIPTYNRRDLLSRCLESIFRQACQAEDFEIVVVLDGGTDSTRDYLRALTFPCAKQIIEQENLGQGTARNAGIRAAHGKYILILDDDFVCAPNLIAEHLAAHDGSATVVVGPIRRDQNNASIPALAVDREIRPFYEKLEAGRNPGRWLPPNSSIAREILLACGGYDERFSRAREDTDLGMRLAEHGIEFRYAPGAIVRQHYDKSANELIDGAALFGKHDVMLARKFPYYAAQSNLSRLNSGPRWKRAVRRLAASLPFSPEPFLYLPYLLSTYFSRIIPLGDTAIRLLNLRRYIVWVRAAVREAGDWRSLVSLAQQTNNSSQEPG
jgi:GT2 family glycosyltransferase